jgi:anti-anti-sigma regulatory factor/HAMP domain-containing protein
MFYGFTSFDDTVSSQSANATYVVTSIPADVIFRRFDQALAVKLLSIGVVILAAILLAWRGGHYFVERPVSALVQTTGRLARGDLDSRTQMRHSSDEFGALATAIDQMAVALQQQYRELEQSADEVRRAAAEREDLQQEIINMQEATLRELSTPLIPITAHAVAMPLIGSVDSTRAQQIMTTLLQGIEQRRAAVAILDVTGVPTLNRDVAHILIQTTQAARLLGAQVVLTGVQPNTAQALVELGTDLQGLIAHNSLQEGIAYALRQQQQHRTRQKTKRR